VHSYNNFFLFFEFWEYFWTDSASDHSFNLFSVLHFCSFEKKCCDIRRNCNACGVPTPEINDDNNKKNRYSQTFLSKHANEIDVMLSIRKHLPGNHSYLSSCVFCSLWFMVLHCVKKTRWLSNLQLILGRLSVCGRFWLRIFNRSALHRARLPVLVIPHHSDLSWEPQGCIWSKRIIQIRSQGRSEGKPAKQKAPREGKSQAGICSNMVCVRWGRREEGEHFLWTIWTVQMTPKVDGFLITFLYKGDEELISSYNIL